MLTHLMPGSRNIISIEITPSANSVLRATVKRTSLKKKDILARMCVWFADQDVEVQKIVMGEIPDSLAAAAKEIAIKNLRGKGAVKYDVDEVEPITPPQATDHPNQKP